MLKNILGVLLLLVTLGSCARDGEGNQILINNTRVGPLFTSGTNPETFVFTAPLTQAVVFVVEVADSAVSDVDVFLRVNSAASAATHHARGRGGGRLEVTVDPCLAGGQGSTYKIYGTVVPTTVSVGINVHLTAQARPASPPATVSVGDSLTLAAVRRSAMRYAYVPVPTAWPGADDGGSDDTLVHDAFFVALVAGGERFSLVMAEDGTGSDACPGIQGTPVGTWAAGEGAVSLQASGGIEGFWIGAILTEFDTVSSVTIAEGLFNTVECVDVDTVPVPADQEINALCHFPSNYAIPSGPVPAPTGVGFVNPLPNPYDAVRTGTSEASGQCLVALRAYQCAKWFPTCSETLRRPRVCAEACADVVEYCSAAVAASIDCAPADAQCTAACPTDDVSCSTNFPPPPPPPAPEAANVPCGSVSLKCGDGLVYLQGYVAITSTTTQTEESAIAQLRLSSSSIGSFEIFSAEAACPSTSGAPCKVDGALGACEENCGAACISTSRSVSGAPGEQFNIQYVINAGGDPGACTATASFFVARLNEGDSQPECVTELATMEPCVSGAAPGAAIAWGALCAIGAAVFVSLLSGV